MKMDCKGVFMTFTFAEIPLDKDVKKAVVDILTSEYAKKVRD